MTPPPSAAKAWSTTTSSSAAPRRSDVDPVLEAMRETGQITSMLCFSPNFTHPDPDERARQVERQKVAIDLSVRLGTRYCRTLTGQRYPDLGRREGVRRAVECIKRSLEYAEQRDVVLCLENHYKVGDWLYAEFAQMEDVFLEVIDHIHSPHFGVQYDPSNAVVGGFDPIAFLEKIKDRVVTMHASDRYLVPGTSIDDIRAADGTVGYPDKLRHGETGKGMNDYDAIFRILAGVGFDGWISVEDGMNGLDELQAVGGVPEGETRGVLRGPRGAPTGERAGLSPALRCDSRHWRVGASTGPVGPFASMPVARMKTSTPFERLAIVFVQPGAVDGRLCRAASPGARLTCTACPTTAFPRPWTFRSISTSVRFIGRPTHSVRGPGVPMTVMAGIATARPT